MCYQNSDPSRHQTKSLASQDSLHPPKIFVEIDRWAVQQRRQSSQKCNLRTTNDHEERFQHRKTFPSCGHYLFLFTLLCSCALGSKCLAINGRTFICKLGSTVPCNNLHLPKPFNDVVQRSLPVATSLLITLKSAKCSNLNTVGSPLENLESTLLLYISMPPTSMMVSGSHSVATPSWSPSKVKCPISTRVYLASWPIWTLSYGMFHARLTVYDVVPRFSLVATPPDNPQKCEMLYLNNDVPHIDQLESPSLCYVSMPLNRLWCGCPTFFTQWPLLIILKSAKCSISNNGCTPHLTKFEIHSPYGYVSMLP